MKNSKVASIGISLLFYLVATLIAVFVFKQIPDSYHWLLRVLLADIAATLWIFLGSLLLNNSSMYDPYWSVKPMVIAACYLLVIGPENANLHQWLAFGLMQLYGLRLTSNFYRDWVGFSHEDWRYVNFRQQFPKAYWAVSLGGIHLFPTVMVYLSCLPLYFIFFAEGQSPNVLLLWAGVGVLLLSIVLAFVADEQMRTFRQKPSNKGKLMAEKLWKKSRHPNYLGEILTWWGLFLIALSLDFSFWWAGIGALAINLMFLFVSIPLLDKRSMERRSTYEAYMKESNALLPF